MPPVIQVLLAARLALFRTPQAVSFENLALRHQLAVEQ
jgi:hypothetical protein